MLKKAPTKVEKYFPDFKPEEAEELQEVEKPSKSQKLKEEKPKSLKEKYLVIDVKNRGKKHYITSV